jgi:enoyl-[acyl-carrier protein] reductase I
MAESPPTSLPVKGSLMQGKRGLIMGVANDRSLAWGIAAACAVQGAELAFTYQGEALEKRVRPLAASIGSEMLFPCDVSDEASIDAAFDQLRGTWDQLDFMVHAIGFADKNYLRGRCSSRRSTSPATPSPRSGGARRR